ncbi:heme o synthase [Candidatus Saccharibacteria bacterium]|nr:heme o synthase [Candidatus Saccharibacteria bacterium]
MKFSARIRAYYQLTKPGVLYGNVITAGAGFLFASGQTINWWLFVATIVGTTLVIASACVLNNFLDQDIDQVMSRTKKRPLIAGEVSGREAVIFAILLGVSGVVVLYLWVSWLVVALGLTGYFVYVVLYGMLSKRLSIHGTLVGSVSGAIPILAGYVAVSNRIDLGAMLVFAILFLWQMPEFYSIAVYRRGEYKAAKVPVMSVIKGIQSTKRQVLVYIILFTVVALLLAFTGYAGYTYLVIMMSLCVYWIRLGIISLKTNNDQLWSRRVFRHSLIILLAFSMLISVEAWLP